jgi:hypothetical protein
MGTASSILNNKNLIYISYTMDNRYNKYLQELKKIFMNLNYQILTSKIIVDSVHFKEEDITFELQNIYFKAEIVFVCISNSTIKSFTHLIEQKILYSMNRYVIYLTIEKELDTEVQEYLKQISLHNKIYPFFDDDSYNSFLSILQNNYNFEI